MLFLFYFAGLCKLRYVFGERRNSLPESIYEEVLTMAELNETPSGQRLHIGIWGKTNSGKSSLVNALTGQEVSIVSPEAGTTTDPVYKAVELAPIGPCLFIDTAGLADTTTLGQARMKKTMQVADECDIVIFVFSDYCEYQSLSAVFGSGTDEKDETIRIFQEKRIPMIPVITHADINKTETDESRSNSESESILVGTGSDPSGHVLHGKPEADGWGEPIAVSSVTGEGIDRLRERIVEVAKALPEPTILNGMIRKNDLVMLVMPQDKQAPKGRLILPQVSTLRELLDNHAITVCVAPEEMEEALGKLMERPDWIITDSQVFDYVYARKPEGTKLTSFSILYAGLKGDVKTYMQGAEAIDSLPENARILIAESCSHAPLEEDIGRVKIPNLIRKKTGKTIHVDIAAGKDFPEDLTDYDLIIQCGGCMANRRRILSRIERATSQGVPITNYGIAIAHLNGIVFAIDTDGL